MDDKAAEPVGSRQAPIVIPPSTCVLVRSDVLTSNAAGVRPLAPIYTLYRVACGRTARSEHGFFEGVDERVQGHPAPTGGGDGTGTSPGSPGTSRPTPAATGRRRGGPRRAFNDVGDAEPVRRRLDRQAGMVEVRFRAPGTSTASRAIDRRTSCRGSRARCGAAGGRRRPAAPRRFVRRGSRDLSCRCARQ